MTGCKRRDVPKPGFDIALATSVAATVDAHTGAAMTQAPVDGFVAGFGEIVSVDVPPPDDERLRNPG